jgi:ATP-dependent Zn protease
MDDELTERTKRFFAVHEAGHAVIASLYGLNVKKVVLRPPVGSRCYYEKNERSFTSETECAIHMKIIWAGFVAQEIKTNGRYKPNCGADYINIKKLARKIIELSGKHNNEEDIITQAKQETKLLLEFHWNLVELITDSLLENHVIKGDDVREIIRQNRLDGVDI